MRCFQALLLPCFQYFQYFCNIFQYFQYIFCTFFVLSEYLENKGQNWTKNKLGFLLYELLHQYICGFLQFFLTEMHITKTQKNRGRIFLLFKYFLDNLFLTVFVQNVISKFVKVLPQNLNNSLLEKLWARFCATVYQNCQNCLFSLQLHLMGIFSCIRQTLNRNFECSPFMLLCDCSVSSKGNPGTLSHLKLITY